MRRQFFRALFILALLRAVAGVSPACGGGGKPALKIGVLLPLTGDLSMYAAAFREGLELGRDEINEQGLASGGALELRVEDSRNDTNASHAATKRLLEVDKVDAAIISSYPDVRVGGVEYERAKVPVMVLWDATPEIDSMGDYIFSIGPWIPSAGEAGARFAAQSLGLRHGVIININSTWSSEVSNYFSREFIRLGGRVDQRVEVNQDVTDFKSVILRAMKSRPDFLYTPLDYNPVSFYRQVKQLGFEGAIITSDIISKEHISKDPPAFEGIYQTSIADPETLEYRRLADRYRRMYSKDVTMPWFVATGYDSVMLMTQAFARGNGSPERAKEELYKVQGYHGAARVYSFNSEGSAAQMETVYRIERGELKRLR